MFPSPVWSTIINQRVGAWNMVTVKTSCHPTAREASIFEPRVPPGVSGFQNLAEGKRTTTAKFKI